MRPRANRTCASSRSFFLERESNWAIRGECWKRGVGLGGWDPHMVLSNNETQRGCNMSCHSPHKQPSGALLCKKGVSMPKKCIQKLQKRHPLDELKETPELLKNCAKESWIWHFELDNKYYLLNKLKQLKALTPATSTLTAKKSDQCWLRQQNGKWWHLSSLAPQLN